MKTVQLRYRILTYGSLGGLGAGILLGLAVHGGQLGGATAFVAWLEPIERLWIEALRIIVYPLIVSYLVVAVSNATRSRKTGRIGAVAFVSHVALLICTMVFTIVVGPLILSKFPLTPHAILTFKENAVFDPGFAPIPGNVDRIGSESLPLFQRIVETITSLDIVVVLLASILFS